MRASGPFPLLAAIALAVPALALAWVSPGAAAPAAPDCVPEHVPHLGPSCLEPNGLFRVFLEDGTWLETHGPDPMVPADEPGFGPSADQRAPVCAAAPHLHVLYGHASGAKDRVADVAKSLRDAVRRMNAVLNADALASGNVNADYRVACDANGEIRVDRFAGPDTGGAGGTTADFSGIVSAARAAGFKQPKTDYVIFYDDTSPGVCGVADMTYDDRLSASNANLAGPDYGVTYSGCWTTRTPMHENGHNQGAVQLLAPMSDLNAHCLEGHDVMCYTSDFIVLCSDRVHFDCRFDTYFSANPPAGSWLATHWNIGSRLNPYIAFSDTPAPGTSAPASSSSPTQTASVPSSVSKSSSKAPRTTAADASDSSAADPNATADWGEASETSSITALSAGLALAAIVVARRRK